MFGWGKKDAAVAAELKRVPVGPEFAPILAEYSQRRAGEVFALCLEGGGAKGRWQAGFLARAAEVGLLQLVNVAAGTSVGGLNALCVGRYLRESPDLQALVDIWQGIKKDSDIYEGKLPTDFWGVARGLLAGKLTAESWLDVTPLRALVGRHLRGEYEMDLPVYTVATDYATKKAQVLGPNVDAADRALATSAVPGAFPAHRVAGLGFMDGGCSQNCPYPFLLSNLQATKLLVLYCDPDPETVKPPLDPPSTLKTVLAALGALMQNQSDRAFSDLQSITQIRELLHQTPVEMAHFYPSRETGGLLEFGARPELLQLGYDDAVKYLTPEKVKALLAP